MTGRPTDLFGDYVLYTAVEDYRQQGLTEEKAFLETGYDYLGDLKQPRKNRPDKSSTVKSAWLRHQKRIVRQSSSKHRGMENMDWDFKKEYLEHDRTATPAKRCASLPY